MQDEKNNAAELRDWIKAIASIATPLIVAVLGFVFNARIEEQQRQHQEQLAQESSMRLYTELMSQREQAESALRKDMFARIIESFTDSEKAQVEERVLDLELLAYNFHESFNLMPVFKELEKDITEQLAAGRRRENTLNRLKKLAREITRKQYEALKISGDHIEVEIALDSFSLIFRNNQRNQGGQGFTTFPTVLQVPRDSVIPRYLELAVMGFDRAKEEVTIRLKIKTLADEERRIRWEALKAEEREQGEDLDLTSAVPGLPQFPPDSLCVGNDQEFTVSFFDFPMIDNMRLSDDERCSVILDSFNDRSAILHIICFPGAHAGLKDKPYYDEILERLKPHY